MGRTMRDAVIGAGAVSVWGLISVFLKGENDPTTEPFNKAFPKFMKTVGIGTLLAIIIGRIFGQRGRR